MNWTKLNIGFIIKITIMKNKWSILVAILVLTACGQTKEKKEAQSIEDKEVADLFALMQGSFTSEKQSLADSTYYNISLHMYPIWQEEGNWLYVEQAMNAMQDKPYRQRIYEVKRNKKGELASYVYTIPNDSLWIGKWKTPQSFKDLTMKELFLRDGCEVLLSKTAEGIYEGKTQDGTCESSLRGASYAMSAVRITDSGIESWDQGFDSEGNQVWGATEGGYVFDKLEK